MPSLRRIPILLPNGPDNSYFIGSDAPEGVVPYPEDTQTHAYVHPQAVLAVQPYYTPGSPNPTHSRFGCLIQLAGGAACNIRSECSAEFVAAHLEES
jgi:hypothetical protein